MQYMQEVVSWSKEMNLLRKENLRLRGRHSGSFSPDLLAEGEGPTSFSELAKWRSLSAAQLVGSTSKHPFLQSEQEDSQLDAAALSRVLEESKSESPAESQSGQAQASPVVAQASEADHIESAAEIAAAIHALEADLNPPKTTFTSFLEGDAYELFIGLLIIVNSLVMAVEFEYQGYVMGHDLDYRRMQGPPEEVWASASDVFRYINLVFTVIFVVDVTLRISFLRMRFWKNSFNWLDFVVVVCAVTEILFEGLLPLDTVFIRLLRLGKVARAFRVVRHTEGMSSLLMMLKCVRASFNTLCWSLSFIVVLQCIAGMVISQVVWPYMKDESNNIDERRAVFRYYGTFTSTFLTMFEVLLANWAPPARILVDNVSDLFVYVFVIYRCVVGFAILNVVNAVFIQQTMKVAQADQELILKQRLRAESAYAAKMREFFEKLDSNHSGFLTWKEFSAVLTEPELRSWMATLELETYDLVNLFHMIDDGDGHITVGEFLEGAIRLRGTAKSVDLAQVLNTTRRLDAKVEALLMSIKDLAGSSSNVEAFKDAALDKMSNKTVQRLSLHKRPAIRSGTGSYGVQSLMNTFFRSNTARTKTSFGPALDPNELPQMI
ncbi:unnamed protein product [Effrenium voratum]|nr:unnamed protein product [Effrenium voratum]